MREASGKAAAVTGMIMGSAMDGTNPKIIVALAILTLILVAIAIGGNTK